MNKTADYQFTIIIPFYNEEGNVPALEEKLSKYLNHCTKSPACVLFVNDGSTDRGGALIKEACLRHKDFFYIELESNKGITTAQKAGYDNCFSPIAGYMDADLQTDPEDFNLLLEHIDSHDLVIGYRINRQDSFSRRITSKIANGFRRMMTSDEAIDTCCPLRVIKTDYAKRLPMFHGMHRFVPALVKMMGGTMCQIPVRHYPRMAGVAKYNTWNRLIRPFVDCFGFRWMKKRYKSYSLKDNTADE